MWKRKRVPPHGWYRQATQMPCRANLYCGRSDKVWEMRSGICLYNSSGQPNIPLRHSKIFPQYASEGRITKSTEDPGGRGGVWWGMVAHNEATVGRTSSRTRHRTAEGRCWCCLGREAAARAGPPRPCIHEKPPWQGRGNAPLILGHRSQRFRILREERTPPQRLRPGEAGAGSPPVPPRGVRGTPLLV